MNPRDVANTLWAFATLKLPLGAAPLACLQDMLGRGGVVGFIYSTPPSQQQHPNRILMSRAQG
jgi:hypothetical protein